MDAHVKSIEYINSYSGYDVFNVGTGNPVTILNLIKSFIKNNKIPINYKFIKEKPGDVTSSYADSTKISRVMEWKSKRDLKDMVRDSWIPYSKEI